MTKDKELKALFVMCSDLKAQVKALSEEVKALREARTAPEKMLESMNHLSEDSILVKGWRITVQVRR